MHRADIGVFNLTPFRGPSADPGTVFELGFLFARNKPVFGYTGSAADYVQRVHGVPGPGGEPNSRPLDCNGYAVEDFGLADNLMVVQAIRDSGGSIAVVEEKVESAGGGATLAAFEAFRACLKIISETYRGHR
jgi:nucleoside 2-deoxyribosyltransferase